MVSDKVQLATARVPAGPARAVEELTLAGGGSAPYLTVHVASEALLSGAGTLSASPGPPASLDAVIAQWGFDMHPRDTGLLGSSQASVNLSLTYANGSSLPIRTLNYPVRPGPHPRSRPCAPPPLFRV